MRVTGSEFVFKNRLRPHLFMADLNKNHVYDSLPPSDACNPDFPVSYTHFLARTQCPEEQTEPGPRHWGVTVRVPRPVSEHWI